MLLLICMLDLVHCKNTQSLNDYQVFQGGWGHFVLLWNLCVSAEQPALDGAASSDAANHDQDEADDEGEGGFSNWANEHPEEERQRRRDLVANHADASSEAQNAVAALNGHSEGRQRAPTSAPDDDEESKYNILPTHTTCTLLPHGMIYFVRYILKMAKTLSSHWQFYDINYLILLSLS